MPQISYKIFLDSSFIFAFIDRADVNHLKAAAIMEYLAKNGYMVFTSIYSVINAYNRIDKDLMTTVANDFLSALIESDIEVLYPTRSELISTYKITTNSLGKKASIHEIINADLMDKRGIHQILTFDPWYNTQETQVSNLINIVSV